MKLRIVVDEESRGSGKPTADQWCAEFINQTRTLFKRSGWPLPDGTSGAQGVRAKPDNYPTLKHVKVDPHVEQSDKYFLIRYPAKEVTSEAIIRQIIVGLVHVAVAEGYLRSGCAYELDLMKRGGYYEAARRRVGLLDRDDNLTSPAMKIVEQHVRGFGEYPEGASNRRSEKRKKEGIDMICPACGVRWIPNYPKTLCEEVEALGGWRCPRRSCGEILRRDDDSSGEVLHLRSGRR